MTQFSQVVFIEVLEKFRTEELMMLQVKFAEPLFDRFLQLQEESAQRQIAEFNPRGVPSTEYHNKSMDMHLIREFWTEFRAFCQNLSQRKL